LELAEFWEMVSARQTWLSIQNGGEFPDYRTDDEKQQEIDIERKNLLERYESIKHLMK